MSATARTRHAPLLWLLAVVILFVGAGTPLRSGIVRSLHPARATWAIPPNDLSPCTAQSTDFRGWLIQHADAQMPAFPATKFPLMVRPVAASAPVTPGMLYGVADSDSQLSAPRGLWRDFDGQ